MSAMKSRTCTPTATDRLLIAERGDTSREAWWTHPLQRSPSRENYLFVCSCIKCVSQTDELDVTSEDDEEDEGEAEGETEGDEAEDEMTDVWWKTSPLLLSGCRLLFSFPTLRSTQQPKPRRINNRSRRGKILSVRLACFWFWLSDQRTSELIFVPVTKWNHKRKNTWSVFPWWWNQFFELVNCFCFSF